MLELFRKFGATKAARIFLGLITLCFVAWGVSGYLSHNIGSSAVSVMGRDISAVQLDQVYRQQVARMTQLLGRAPTTEELEQNHLAESIVADLVTREVLRATAEDMGLMAATKQLQDVIAAMPDFHNQAGAFDPAVYRAVLAQNGRSAEQFEAEMSADLGVRMLGSLIKVEEPSLEAARAQAEVEKASLVLEVANLGKPGAAEIGEPSADDLKKHYELNQKLYTTEEKRSFAVLEVSREAVAKGISVADERVREEYEANKATYAAPEMRRVRHILLASEEAAKDAAAKIKSVDDFKREANAVSTDPGNAGGKGGDLGEIGKDSVVPEFGEVAFKLAPGTLSAPVKSAFGWHLIWVEGVTPARTRSFDEVKQAIADNLKATEADEALDGILKTVEDKTADGEKLEAVAKGVGLSARVVNLVRAQGDQGIPAEVVKAAFETEKGQTSAPLTMTDGGASYVQVTEVVPAKVEPLEAVKDRVKADWAKVKEQVVTQQRAEKILAAAKAAPGRSMAEAVAQSGVAGVTVSGLSVNGLEGTPAWLHKSLLDLYQLPSGATLAKVLDNGGGAALVRLKERVKPTLSDADVATFAKELRQRMQADAEALVVSELVHNAKVSCNQTRMRQIFGRAVACTF